MMYIDGIHRTLKNFLCFFANLLVFFGEMKTIS